VPIVTAAGAAGQIPAPTAAMVMDYLEAVSTAASNSITEWESGDPDTVKIAAIAANFAAVPAPSLGPGVSSVIQASISSIGNLIEQLMQQIQGAQASLIASTAGTSAVKSKVLALQISDKHKLNSLKAKADKNIAAIEGWKAQQKVRARAAK
jgi:hypothetical protein